MPKEKFYKQGLHFGCTECGQCCSHPEGVVELTSDELTALADYLGIDEGEFRERYISKGQNDDVFELQSHKNGDCIFLEDERCQVYEVRPLQCRTYPFWPEIVKSSFRWNAAARDCPGIGQGRLYSGQEIEALVKQMRKK